MICEVPFNLSMISKVWDAYFDFQHMTQPHFRDGGKDCTLPLYLRVWVETLRALWCIQGDDLFVGSLHVLGVMSTASGNCFLAP